MKPIRVMIADDHAIVRSGIAALLDTTPDMELVAEARDGKEAVERAMETAPDVILMDLVMPGVDGVAAIRRIMARRPESRILVLTSYSTDKQVFSAIRAGAAGYHLKSLAPLELEAAIRQVAQGKSALNPSVAQRVLSELTKPSSTSPCRDRLTPRETEVLQLIAQGMSNRTIADTLIISEVTVRTHVSRILSKLRLASRTQAALWALRSGLAELDAPDQDAIATP